MGEENSIYSKRASWAQRDERHQKCVRANFGRRSPASGGHFSTPDHIRASSSSDLGNAASTEEAFRTTRRFGFMAA